ncbi:hypothetical protein LBMAG57_25490 [Verrucomicrobiota bacterium]|nr:hypothetical protein LBMAG57_25490 [Verrucomicrobiota bacterium]
MITRSNEEKLAARPEAEGIKISSALPHRQMVELLQKTGHQPDLFDDKAILNVSVPDQPTHRCCLSRISTGRLLFQDLRRRLDEPLRHRLQARVVPVVFIAQDGT